MNIAIVIIIGFIAVAFFVDAFKQRSGRKDNSAQSDRPQRILTADESGPTETGRFRVQQALSATGAAPNGEVKNSSPEAEEEAPLPDPFDNEDSGKDSKK